MKHLLFLGIAFAAFHISHSTPGFCRLPYEEGEGSSFTFALYYDADNDQCSPFIYKGQGGNANRFENERECIRNCSANVDSIYPFDEAAGKTVSALSISNTPPSGERAGLLMTDETSQACHFKKAIGTCSGKFLRYYYDSVHDKCKKFLWSGCIGNGNRFFDFNSCNATCAGIHDDRDEQEEEEPDTPIAIIGGVLIAVIIAAILITVIVLTVNSGKKGSKKKAPGKSRDPQSESHLQEKGIEMA